MQIKITKECKQGFARLGLNRPGWSDDWQEHWWDWVKTFYWKVVPYRWRPSEVWYRFTCWAWRRYTTVHPRTMPWHTWTDRDFLLPHVMFELLVRFVEEEKPEEHFEIKDSANRELWEKLFATYHWWKNEFVPYYSRERKGELTEADDAIKMYQELSRRCHDLIDVKHLMWT